MKTLQYLLKLFSKKQHVNNDIIIILCLTDGHVEVILEVFEPDDQDLRCEVPVPPAAARSCIGWQY